jgi:hypothetical protein
MGTTVVTKYQKKLAWSYHNSPTLESYIEKRLNKVNNNPVKATKHENTTK